MSHHISQWSIGSSAEWKGPFGSFTYTPNKVYRIQLLSVQVECFCQFDRIGMLACGTGIAPMIQVIRSATPTFPAVHVSLSHTPGT